jgi:hypothetical protein
MRNREGNGVTFRGRRLMPLRTYLAIALALIASGCSTPAPTATGASSPNPSPVAVASPPAATPATVEPTARRDDLDLPDPGGTCSAAQLALSPSTSAFDFSTLGSEAATVEVSVNNRGAACDLSVPKVIGVASADGPFTAITVTNIGNAACVKQTCRYVALPSYRIKARGAAAIRLHANWPMEIEGLWTPDPCQGSIAGVARAEVPLAVGQLEFGWSTVFKSVCPSRKTIDISVELT